MNRCCWFALGPRGTLSGSPHRRLLLQEPALVQVLVQVQVQVQVLELVLVLVQVQVLVLALVLG